MSAELEEETLASTYPVDSFESPATVRALTILCHPDWDRVGETLVLRALLAGQEVLLSRGEPVFSNPGQGGRPLAERHLSRQPIRLRETADAGVVIDLGTTRTRVAVDGERIDRERVLSRHEIGLGVVLTLARQIVLLLHEQPLSAPQGDHAPTFGLIGASPAMGRVRREIRKLAPLDVPVLLRGATGTGKELVARALHDASPRRQRPFVAVNMAVLGPSLAAAALFGAERGAYTGADRKRLGHFESAQGGTLFLDEVAEAPPEVQAMLLRVLETREIQPIGSSDSVPVDVRIVAATDSRLEEAIAEDRFKTPLYHRLAGYTVHLPALRERREDLGRLLYFFLRQERGNSSRPGLGSSGRPWPSAELVASLALHGWPGNVRELRNVARRLAIAGDDEEIPVLDLLLPSTSPGTGGSAAGASGFGSLRAPAATPPRRRKLRRLDEVSEAELLAALREHRWQIQAAADALEVSRPNLYRLMEASAAVRTAGELGLDEIRTALDASGNDLEAAALALEVSELGLKRRMKTLGLEIG